MSQQLKELREKQAKIVADARARLAEITDETPEARRTELETQHDGAMAEYDVLEARADRLEKLIDREKKLEPDARRRPDRDDRIENPDDDGDEPDPKAVFRRAMMYGSENLNDRERRAMAGFRANVSEEMRAQSVGTTTAGGFTLPQGFLPEITKTMADWGPMNDEGIVRMIRTSTGVPLPWPTVNDTANTGVDHVENVADAEQDAVFGQKTLNAYMASSGIVKVSLELLQDSAFDFDSLLSELFGERLGRRVNAKLTTGTGTDQANGIVTASTLGKTAASATALAADEFFDLQHSVNPAYRRSPKAHWQFNDTTLKLIRKLKDGQGNYLWQMGDVKAGSPATLLGDRYHVNQAMADVATGTKPVIYGDGSKYINRMVKDFTMLTLRERFADALQVGFIAFCRFDGELADTAAVKHMIMA